jgi:indole-3-glycerol phosphate synthase
MPTTLDQILTSTRDGLGALHARREALAREAATAPAARPFGAALRGDRVRVIAELKRRSPSAGSIRDDLDPAGRAALYAAHGAAAVSVLTDGPFFGGSVEDLRSAARAAGVPLLRKDFILDELQIVEARAAGASAVLLIVRALPPDRLRALLGAARAQGLEALVEVHTEDELDRALDAGARVIGVNSRDLDTFRIDIAAAWRLLALVPPEAVAVAESGMATADDVARAADAGADAVLVGSALSRAADPAGLLEALAAVARRGR